MKNSVNNNGTNNKKQNFEEMSKAQLIAQFHAGNITMERISEIIAEREKVTYSKHNLQLPAKGQRGGNNQLYNKRVFENVPKEKIRAKRRNLRAQLLGKLSEIVKNKSNKAVTDLVDNFDI